MMTTLWLKMNSSLISLLIFFPFLLISENNPTALIIGITGQDGSYLAELLLKKDYIVHGTVRSLNSPTSLSLLALPVINEAKINNRLILHEGNVTDFSFIKTIIPAIAPTEIYNLAAQSHVGKSFDSPEETQQINAFSVLYILEAIRIIQNSTNKQVKFCQASTGEIFDGKTTNTLQEISPFYPRSPYAVAKLYAHWLTISYRETYNIFACNAILFNHESPRRGLNFVTRKITKAAASYSCNEKNILHLGNLNAHRDWGFAADYVEALSLMLQQDKPNDYIIATGIVHSVREFVTHAYKEAGYDITWVGEGVEEKGLNQNTGEVIVQIDPAYFRPTEPYFAPPDNSKAREKLGWSPRTTFHDLIKQMVENDYKQTCSN